jgi:GNAT superfamily N-acetyltransferase
MSHCMEQVTTIRLAGVDEVERLVEMGERFHRESSYKEHVAHNHEQMIALATNLVAAGNILVMEFNGALVGMIGFMVLPHFLSGEVIGIEVFWWLEPEHRGEGKKLLKAAEDLARERGAKRMQMIAPNERVGVLYRRMGYEFVESAFQKTL